MKMSPLNRISAIVERLRKSGCVVVKDKTTVDKVTAMQPDVAVTAIDGTPNFAIALVRA